MGAFLKSLVLGAAVISAPGPGASESPGEEGAVVVPENASPLEVLAAREIVRYVYLRTGTLLPLRTGAPPASGALYVARRGRAGAEAAEALGPQEYRLCRIGGTLGVFGGDDVGTLYGAYRLAEHLGIRFYLHGDVVPDGRIAWRLPDLEEIGKPGFEIRGILPFHDFPEGPDGWDRDDYLSCLAQLVKLRMNFVGFHAYPEGEVGPEPLVWIGWPSDLEPDGRIRFAYPAQWATTARPGRWGYAPSKTQDFCAGAAALFAEENHG
ncbi:MAG: hypothetical protein ACK44W_15480, partial [Planctomycetota bacterium]